MQTPLAGVQEVLVAFQQLLLLVVVGLAVW